jgi:O-acetyl-ADP-ribose deacetylase (regulator of RNase III)
VRIELVTGDITTERVDAIVNAANCSLLPRA